jgi:hypothetical protein
MKVNIVSELNRDELLERMKRLDEDISLIYEKGERLICVIVGGSALVLLNCIARATHDIDVIKCSGEVHILLQKYDFNGQVQTYINNFPYNFEDRFVKLNLETKAVDFYTASLEDIVIAKLFSGRTVDYADIREKCVLGKIDWQLLDNLSKEVKLSALNERNYNEFLEKYNEYVSRWKP